MREMRDSYSLTLLGLPIEPLGGLDLSKNGKGAKTHLGAVGLAGVLLAGGILLVMGRAGRRKYTDMLDHCDSSEDHNDTVGFVGVTGKLGVL